MSRLASALRSRGPSACRAQPDSPACSTNAAAPAGSPSGQTSRSPTAGNAASAAGVATDLAVLPRVLSRARQNGENGPTASTTCVRSALACADFCCLAVLRSQDMRASLGTGRGRLLT